MRKIEEDFKKDWEQRKAIDIADYSKGNGYSKGDLTDAGTPIILYGRLYTKYQFAISEVDTFAVPRNGAVYSQGNEVIVPASGETAEDIARASAVEKSGVLLGGDLNILRPFDFINPLFLALAISNGEPQKELAKKAQGKSVVHIHNTDIQEVTIAYPSRTEQDRIVSVFRQLDNLITLHQRKLELRFFPGCMFFIWVRMLTWCPATKEQGIAGSEAPRPTGRSPILSQRRGTRRRKNKALGGAKHHVQPAEIRFCSKDVVPGDERTRHWGERSTTPNRPNPHLVSKTWCPATKNKILQTTSSRY